MKVYSAHHAQDIGGRGPGGAVIYLEDELRSQPAMAATQDDMDEDSEMLCRALCEHLPGGTLDRLVGRLLLNQASSLVIAKP